MRGESMKVIEVFDATKHYGSHTVLDKVNVSFEAGKIHGIVGRNGSGKTMLLKAICGFIRLSSGKITVKGKVIGTDVDFAPDIGVILEQPTFIPYFSGYRNLETLASYRRVIGKDEIRAAIRMVGLDADDKKSVRKYSLGMNQRLGIAQALMENPDILVMDEPFNGLDNQGVQEVRKLFKNLRDQGKLIIICSHNKEDIDLLCDEVYQMDAGKLTIVQMDKLVG